jgi:hypothetical protein
MRSSDPLAGGGTVMNILEVDICEGSVVIREDDLPYITRADLRKWEISRRVLHRCFAKGVELMRGRSPRDRVRPCASQRPDRKWEVYLCGYSSLSDPLMQGVVGGSVQ